MVVDAATEMSRTSKPFEAPTPEKLAAVVRQVATKMAIFEGLTEDFVQAMHMCNVLSATTLRQAIAKGAGKNLTSAASEDAQPSSDSTRSFMIKRGDADVHEMYTAAAQCGRPVSSSGSLSSNKPLSKEEMAKARSARLALLEQQQADKHREQEGAAERGKAREALFNRPFTGTAKPLGKI